MFFSSFFPLYCILIILNYEFLFIEVEEKDTVKNIIDINVAILLVILTLLIIISVISLFIILFTKGNSHSYNLVKIEKSNEDIISYIMTYIIPILEFDIYDEKSIVVNVILFLMIGYLYTKMDLLYLNPLWTMFGYIPYQNGDGVVITNIPYHTLKNLEKIKWSGNNISNNVVIIRRKDNSKKIS